MSEMRMPCPSSTRLNPSCFISRSISAPSVWRPEFQLVENAIMVGTARCAIRRMCVVGVTADRMDAAARRPYQDNESQSLHGNRRGCRRCQLGLALARQGTFLAHPNQDQNCDRAIND